MTDALLSLKNVTVRFGGLTALDSFSMDVRRGTITALIGPNGAGKSTAFNAISRVYSTASGEIVYDGQPITRHPPEALARLGIARTFQNIEACAQMTVIENVLVGMSSRIGSYNPFWPSRRRTSAEAEAIDAADAILERTNLSEKRNTRADELDFGHQKMLDIARALAAGPKLLLLDEPAAGLRNREIAALDELLKDLCRKDGITILLVEHVMQLVMSIAESITVLNFGRKIAEGVPSAIQGNAQVVEAYLGSGYAQG
ncbi:ABC transporter ATP-binding protein [Agrobacterium tumefaciens]|nr:ABC transporter ATP-binding protein [Agrobacterium tumefaciens]TQN62437.1 ABC transporter ATP-binding protein [Agrobacterium tumefaciens]